MMDVMGYPLWFWIVTPMATTAMSMMLRHPRLVAWLNGDDWPVAPVAPPRPVLNPYLTQKVLPYDPNLAAIGVLQPEFVETVDKEAWDKYLLDEAYEDFKARDVSDVEYVMEMGSDQPVAIIGSMGQVKARFYKDPPTKTELRWVNTLAVEDNPRNYEFTLPQPGQPTMCLLDHKHNTHCAPIIRGMSEPAY